jgi:hypothetical protein
MKTIDNCDYKPGMTLYSTRDGKVIECKTQNNDKHLPDLAVGTDDRLHSINGHYRFRDNAYVAATNYWLRILRGAEYQLACLNAERDGRPLPEAPRGNVST